MSFTISLNNQLGASYPDDKVYWAIVGQNQSGQYCHMDSSGKLVPMSPTDNKHVRSGPANCEGSDEFANYSMTVADTPSITIDDSAFINSAVIYVSLDDWLPICAQSGGYAPPSVSNPGLQGYGMTFQQLEFAYNVFGGKLMAVNTTNVDYMGIPATLSLTDGGGTRTVGFSSDRSAIISAFADCSNTNFQALVIRDGGTSLRVLSPEHAAKGPNGNPPPPGMNLPAQVVDYFSSFYTQYVADCWTHYANQPLTIYIDGNAFTGQVQSGKFNWWAGTSIGTSDPILSLRRPENWEVLQNAGIFKTGDATQMNIEKFMAAAMYRTVFMETPTSTQNSWSSPGMVGKYYTNAPVNEYAKILHAMSEDGLCYAFAFDDVDDQSSSLQSTSTQAIEITLPAWT